VCGWRREGEERAESQIHLPVSVGRVGGGVGGGERVESQIHLPVSVVTSGRVGGGGKRVESQVKEGTG
jgi:hypothetical protein